MKPNLTRQFQLDAKNLCYASLFAAVELQWDMYNEHKEREIYEKDPEYIQIRDELRARFNKEPLVSDVRWGLANRKSIEHCQNNDWGLYRNTKSEMAKILEKENRIKESLRIYLEFFFLPVLLMSIIFRTSVMMTAEEFLISNLSIKI